MDHHLETDRHAPTAEIAPSSDGTAYEEEQRRLSDVPSDWHAGDILLDRDDFQIRLASRRGMIESRLLVDRRYSWRGYKRSTHLAPVSEADEITLQVCRGTAVFGTLTVRFDSDRGLAADLLYGDEIDARRQAGATVAELTRLAVDPNLGSKEVLGTLFHHAYICVDRLRNASDVFIEVHPRHVPFYRRMLKFRRAGECKMSPRVEAPAVLLHVEVAYVGEQAGLYGGRGVAANRSLYPYFCSPQKEAAAIQRLLDLGRMETSGADTLASARPNVHAALGRGRAGHAEGIAA